jgi:short-subunit dehydrogenase
MQTLTDRVAVVTGAASGIGRATALELAPHNIGVTAVYPLIVRTNISKTTRTTKDPLPAKAGNPISGGAHSPEFVAEHIVRAIRRNQARALVGGGMRLLDLGKRLLPVTFDRLLGRFLEQ